MYPIKKITRCEAAELFESRTPLGLFYVREANGYTGIDNSTGHVWTEYFPTLKKCWKWLVNPGIEADDRSLDTTEFYDCIVGHFNLTRAECRLIENILTYIATAGFVDREDTHHHLSQLLDGTIGLSEREIKLSDLRNGG